MPPKGVRLDTDAVIATHAKEIYLKPGAATPCRPAIVTKITADERALLVAWYVRRRGETSRRAAFAWSHPVLSR